MCRGGIGIEVTRNCTSAVLLFGLCAGLCHLHATRNPWLCLASYISSNLAGSYGRVFVRAQRTTFVLTIPIVTPDLPSPRGAPQFDESGPQTFPTKYTAHGNMENFNINMYYSCIG